MDPHGGSSPGTGTCRYHRVSPFPPSGRGLTPSRPIPVTVDRGLMDRRQPGSARSRPGGTARRRGDSGRGGRGRTWTGGPRQRDVRRRSRTGRRVCRLDGATHPDEAEGTDQGGVGSRVVLQTSTWVRDGNLVGSWVQIRVSEDRHETFNPDAP